jgi:hypothetical protein
MGLKRARGKLDVGRDDPPGVLSRAKLMDQGLANYANVFTSPNPPLPAFSNQIVATDKAHVAVGQGGKGLAEARDVQIDLLWDMMSSQLVYIQSVANAASNPAEAVQILKQGGVEVVLPGGRNKAVVAATQGQPGAPVVLDANAKVLLGENLYRKHFFNWEYTTDGKTFTALPPTPEATTMVSGLTALTTVGFRVSATTSKGVTTPWSPIVNFLVR